MRLFFTFIFAFSFHIIFAQDLQYDVNAASGSVVKQSFILNWSLGDINYEAYSNSEVSLVNNYLYEELPHGFPEIDNNKYFFVFPNPVLSVLNILIDNQFQLPVDIKIYNIGGTVIYKKTLSSYFETINLSYLAAGFYIIEFVQDTDRIKVFKIIKN